MRRCPSLASLASSRRLLEQLASGHAAQCGSVTLDMTTPTAVLTISNVSKANAFSPAMMLQFSDAITALESASTCRSIIVCGADGRFCSGADIGSAGDSLRSPAAGAAMSDIMTDATRRLASLPLISVSALDGGAVGGGAELALATDFRVCAPDAFFHFVQVDRGVVPGWGGLSRLAQLAGRQTALYLLASAARVDAQHAATFGLVEAIVTPTAETSIVQHAAKFLRPLLRTDGDSKNGASEATATAIAMLKSALVEDDIPTAEHRAFRRLWGTPLQDAASRRRK